MDKKEHEDFVANVPKAKIKIEGKDQTASEIAEYVWKMFLLEWDETIDHMDMYDFQKVIRRML